MGGFLAGGGPVVVVPRGGGGGRGRDVVCSGPGTGGRWTLTPPGFG